MFVQLWDSQYAVYLDISLNLLVGMWVGDFSTSWACRFVGGTLWQFGAATSICLFSDCCPFNWLWYGLYGLSLFHGPPFWFPAQACALASYTWSDLVVTSFCYSSINYSSLLEQKSLELMWEIRQPLSSYKSMLWLIIVHLSNWPPTHPLYLVSTWNNPNPLFPIGKMSERPCFVPFSGLDHIYTTKQHWLSVCMS